MPTVHVSEETMEMIEEIQEDGKEQTGDKPPKSFVVSMAISGLHGEKVRGDKVLVGEGFFLDLLGVPDDDDIEELLRDYLEEG